MVYQTRTLFNPIKKIFVAVCALFLTSISRADSCMQTLVTDFGTVTCVYDGGTTTLYGTTASDWWYGCTATSAGMLVAYYDTNGYNGYSYSNLIAGGTAGSSVTGTWVANTSGALFRSVVASTEYQRDYYSAETYGYNTGGGTGYGYETSDDDSTNSSHTNNCLADYMGTSQDYYGNSNGSTIIYYYENGSKLYTSTLLAQSSDIYNSGNAAVGIVAYIESCGYTVLSSYSQYSDVKITGGFSFEEYVAEILAGRPVLLSYYGETAGGHTMIGIGYIVDDKGNEYIEFYNTWDDELYTVLWTGTYYDMTLQGVFVLELATVPEPAAYAMILGIVALAVASKCRKKDWCRFTPSYRKH
jgi:hypothetical protein